MKCKLNTPRHNLIGKRFGKLLVIKFSHYEEYGKNERGTIYRRPIWLCRCECGNSKLLQASLLKRGQVSCGCALIEYRKWAKENFKPKNTKPSGEAAFNDLCSRYKEHAKKVGVNFLLTKDEFKLLTKQNCYYCGQIPNQSLSGRNSKRKGYNGEYIYNGIDRKNNELGYSEENCLPCCGICNKAKRNLTFEDFNIWIQKLTQHQVKKI